MCTTRLNYKVKIKMFKQNLKREFKMSMYWFGAIQLVLQMVRGEPLPFVVLGVILIISWLDS